MQRLVMGGNAALRTTRFDLTIDWPPHRGLIDTSAYMLGSEGKVRGDQDMVFYNQRSDEAGSVRITDIASDRTCFAIDLMAVPAAIQRIVFCMTIEDAGQTMSAFNGAGARISTDGEILFGFHPELAEARESAMRMIEIYRRHDTWKIRADGQGFNDGLAALARSFGIDVADDEAPPPRIVVAPVTAPAAPSSAMPDRTSSGSGSAPGSAPLVEPVRQINPAQSQTGQTALAAAGSSDAAPLEASSAVSLSAENQSHFWPVTHDKRIGAIVAQLAWTSQCGGQNQRARPLDLALGCLFELHDGRSGVIQGWDARGQFEQPPYVQLLPPEGELPNGVQRGRINGEQAQEIRRLALFAFILGPPNWQASSIKFDLTAGGDRPIPVALDPGSNGNGLVSLVQFDFAPTGITARRLGRCYPSHPEMADELGWHLQWRVNPRLHMRSK